MFRAAASESQWTSAPSGSDFGGGEGTGNIFGKWCDASDGSDGREPRNRSFREYLMNFDEYLMNFDEFWYVPVF